jgi:hypothetical protein
MSNRKLLALISLLVFAAAAVLLGLQIHQSSSLGRSEVVSNASGAGLPVTKGASSGSGTLGEATRAPSHLELTSHRPVVAGGSGAGKASPTNVVKAPQRSEVPAEVFEAAKTGLPFFLGRIPPGSKELYGFASADDLSAAQLGRPRQMLTITPAAIQKSSSGATVSSILSETSMWFFPIQIESKAKSMLVVDRDRGEWKAVSMGYAGLGHELNELLAQWPESKGFHPQLVAVFQAKQFYFTVPEVDDFNLTKIRQPQGASAESTMSALGTRGQLQGYGMLSVLSDSLEELKPIVLRAQNFLNR